VSDLADFLRAAATRGFALGEVDCSTMVADWVHACRGADPLPDRGEAAARVHLDCWGGLVRAVGRHARAAGLRLTRAPRPGDIGVLAAGGYAFCALRTRRGWAARLDGGLARFPDDSVRVIAAWRV
jgi:hypothetical protein